MKNILNKCAAFFAAAAIFSGISCQASWQDDYPWAVDGVNYCLENDIMSGNEYGDLMLGDYLTREQMAKLLTNTFNLDKNAEPEFNDVDINHWSYEFTAAISAFMKKKSESFNGGEYVTREEFVATMMLAAGLKEGNVRNSDFLSRNFSDASEVDSNYYKLFTIAAERAYINGYDGYLTPKALMTRAEICTLLYRVSQSLGGKITLTWQDLGVKESWTPLVGEPQVTVEQAQAWAADRGAHERFIEIAPVYWKYGEITGLRPEVLYAQAAKETGFGKYGGAVLPEMNNWAGIKTKSASGDRTEDHETFATPDDGVRAHFNHMCAYVGLEPVGEPHDRYFVVKSIAWAGSVENIEALGGRWCPDLYYGYSILKDYVTPMILFDERGISTNDIA